MPAVILKTATASPEDFVPSDYGITNGTPIRVHAGGVGGRGADADGMGSGGGGGSGERCGGSHTVADADAVYTYYVPDINEQNTTYFRDPDLVDIVAAYNGENCSGQVGGAAAGGGTGDLYVRSGATGGDGSMSDPGGGAGAGAALDASAGTDGPDGGLTGGIGTGAGTQFAVASAGKGGDGGDATEDGSLGDLYSSGGGGGGFPGGVGANGRQPLIIVVWGDMLTSYPPAPFVDGYVPDAGGGSTANWFLLLGR